MVQSAKTYLEFIKNRRSKYPQHFVQGKEIQRDIILEILDTVRFAPTHKKTEPWRFKVFQSQESRQALSHFQEEFYRQNNPGDTFDPLKMKKASERPLQSAVVIAICMQRDPKLSLPEWEETAATAMAVQNLWLAASAFGIGAYWSSPESIYHMTDFLQLAEGESCIGIFYMGWSDIVLPLPERKSLEEIIEWK